MASLDSTDTWEGGGLSIAGMADKRGGKGFYTVMQSDGNRLYGDVVSESYNKTSRDEDNISDQISKSRYVRIIIMIISILYNIIRKYILTLQ